MARVGRGEGVAVLPTSWYPTQEVMRGGGLTEGQGGWQVVAGTLPLELVSSRGLWLSTSQEKSPANYDHCPEAKTSISKETNPWSLRNGKR